MSIQSFMTLFAQPCEGKVRHYWTDGEGGDVLIDLRLNDDSTVLLEGITTEEKGEGYGGGAMKRDK